MSVFSRRSFLESLIASSGLAATSLGQGAASPSGDAERAGGRIDRRSLVSRHCPVIRKLDPLSPLSLGNGEFAFTCDITGLQTFPQEYETAMPLCTMSQWGWHTSPPLAGADSKSLRLTEYDTHGRPVGYATSSEGQNGLYNWLRENPHRLHLGRIGLNLDGAGDREAKVDQITETEQRLDLWRGLITSRFKFEGVPVTVRTAVHPDLDVLAIEIDSQLIADQKLAVRISFPYGSPAMNAADWNRSDAHKTIVVGRTRGRVNLERRVDRDRYFVALGWRGDGTFAADEKLHSFVIAFDPRRSHAEMTVAFSASTFQRTLPSAAATFAESAAHWRRFWSLGGAIELAGSRDSRAAELERRIVLSQYLTAIQCAGSNPPQETGLTVNSWYGKFHLEMHWWHAA
ncbi:MAG TPA: glycoside hydrolase family 65, partial [Blastocatellia bacterium]|nr:glycoside hydrolase family 65 [Blastocatellia bacterium]